MTGLEPIKAHYISYLNLQDQITLAIERQDEEQLHELEQAGKKILEQVITLKVSLPTFLEFHEMSLDVVRELQELIQQAQEKNEKNSELLRGWIKGARPNHSDTVASTASTYSSLSCLSENRMTSLNDDPVGKSSCLSPFSCGSEKADALGEQVNHQS